MPFIKNSSYTKAPFFLRTGHWETIYPAIVRKVRGIKYQRERLELADGDFVDLDWIKQGSQKLILLMHGLEGNTERHYMKGMAKKFSQQKWDVLAMNCRSCSGEMNRKMRLYNHGEIGDIGEVIEHALIQKNYEEITLVGFSMGGSIILKYLGVNGGQHPKSIKTAVAFSSPVDLHGSVAKLDEPECAFYKKRFMGMLYDKIKYKAEKYPDVMDFNNMKKVKNWKDFDHYFSAPLNGYKNADDFYTQASAINFMPDIQIPVLLVNAQNDPILTPSCFPIDFAKAHQFLHLEIPEKGGHVGFSSWGKTFAWSEERTWEFVNERY